MSSNVQPQNSWMMHVSSACSQSVKEEVETDKSEDSETCAVVSHHDKSLTERDYIGLSAMPASASTSILHNLVCSDSNKCSDSREEESACGDTELRLGIGPFNGDVSALHTTHPGGHVAQSVPHQHVSQQAHILKQAEEGSNASHFLSHGGMSGATSVEFHQSFWPWGPGVAPGRFMIPVPKISMVPAKRPYLEVMCENGNKASVCALATNPNTLAEPVTLERGASQNTSSISASPLPIVASSSSSSQGGSFYAWSASTSVPPHVVTAAAWQQGNCNQDGLVGVSPVKNSYPTRALPPPPLFKPCVASQAGQMPPVMSNQLVAPHSGLSEDAHTHEAHKEDASRNKSPMVGWPPVRSFRKNTLQSAAGLGTSKGNCALTDVRSHDDTSKANDLAADQQLKASTKPDAPFVKAKLDGVRICRKVDLSSYSSYDSLKAALQEMFQGFVCNDNAKLDLVHGTNYVLTHEDKDGDMMLVGDVPWRMFITTVKSLRIMKAVDAVGLDGKAFAKLKAQD